VLSYLLISISHDVLVQIAVLPTDVVVWRHIEEAFASQSRARAITPAWRLSQLRRGQ
jgi:hypothetical protein